MMAEAYAQQPSAVDRYKAQGRREEWEGWRKAHTQRERNGKYKNEKERHEFIGCSEFITWMLSSFRS